MNSELPKIGRLMKNIYTKKRFYIALAFVCLLFLVSHFLPFLLLATKVLFFIFVMLLIVDAVLLFRDKRGIGVVRVLPEKLSNGDENPINIWVKNNYVFPVSVEIIDEIPIQFQVRDISYTEKIKSKEEKNIQYTLRPTERGEYKFGFIYVYASTVIGFFAKRYYFQNEKELACYPSFLQMRKYELIAIHDRNSEFGIKKMRRIGYSKEFEQIKQYVSGDDYRNVNWKASARRNHLMVNQFQDERSQNVYSVIDKGRVMKMPFNGLTLLDYAINTALAISNIALKKDDKVGLLTFSKKIDFVLKARKSGSQIRLIQEALYNQETDFKETDFQKLYSIFKTRLSQRSLIMLYTNFESISGLNRQLPYLRKLARQHVLVVVFFKNTELDKFSAAKAKTVDQVYDKVIAEKLIFDKKVVVKEMKKYGIQSILTEPENLTINTINKYLELKARGVL